MFTVYILRENKLKTSTKGNHNLIHGNQSIRAAFIILFSTKNKKKIILQEISIFTVLIFGKIKFFHHLWVFNYINYQQSCFSNIYTFYSILSLRNFMHFIFIKHTFMIHCRITNRFVYYSIKMRGKISLASKLNSSRTLYIFWY